MIHYLRFIERDGKKILQQGIEVEHFQKIHYKEHGTITMGKSLGVEVQWSDVPFKNNP